MVNPDSRITILSPSITSRIAKLLDLCGPVEYKYDRGPGANTGEGAWSPPPPQEKNLYVSIFCASLSPNKSLSPPSQQPSSPLRKLCPEFALVADYISSYSPSEGAEGPI